jgi:hypothetical protein
VTTDPEKLKEVWKWPPLKDKHNLRIFLGLNIAKLLTQLMEEKRWSPEA